MPAATLRRPRGRRYLVGVAVIATAGLSCAVPTSADAAPAHVRAGVDHVAPASSPTAGARPGQYVVTLTGKPVATYGGGIAGIPATRPARGADVDTQAPNARALGRMLVQRQTDAARAVGATASQHYTVALNGFSAKLTSRQVLALRARADVVSVVPDTLRRVTNDQNSQDFLKLSGPNGVWSKLGGIAESGKGVVVGVIDTGIWPESPSFAAPALRTKAPTDPYSFTAYRHGAHTYQHKADGGTFTGLCQTGQQFTLSDCNQKIISARYFGAGFVASGAAPAGDYLSPRDGEGHGTHTASTAVGDNNVDAVVQGHDYGAISGIAPAASLAVYKALWAPGTGATSDIIAAIDQAVADGVDILSFSVGSQFGESPVDDPVSLAFLSAASAGIFVSAAAGNEGPDPSSLDNTGPWVTTVAASTIAPYNGSVTLGDGRKFTGGSASVFHNVGPAPLLTSSAAALSSADPDQAALCYPDTLDPAKAKGKIVICDRGVIARVAKSVEVQRVGGVGMILANTSDLETDADITSVPTVHLNLPAATKVKAYAGTANPTATLVPGNTTGLKTPYPQIAAFSSRGPSIATGGDIIKPDIAAPGVSILAAIAPASNNGHNFEFESGTSMATPHVAGIAALLMAKYPSLTPMEVKSALMTSAGRTVTGSGAVNTDVYSDGSGEVSPTRMLSPGLVYDSGADDWLAYLEGRGVKTGTGVKGVPAWNINSPSFGSGRLIGTRTFTRTVTALTPGIYRASADLPGMSVTVRPSILTFNDVGDTRTFTVTMTQTSQPSGVPTSGHLTWTGAGISVRSPIAVTPFNADAPTNVTGTGAKGHVSFRVRSGAPDLEVEAFGLTHGKVHKGTVSTNGASYKLYDFTVTSSTVGVHSTVIGTDPADTLFGEVITDPDHPAKSKLVDGGFGVGQRVDLYFSTLAPGKYGLLVFGTSGTGAPSVGFQAQTDLVDLADENGSLTVTPTTIAGPAGTTAKVTASWTGASPKIPSTGYVRYNGSTTGTFVSVN